MIASGKNADRYNFLLERGIAFMYPQVGYLQRKISTDIKRNDKSSLVLA